MPSLLPVYDDKWNVVLYDIFIAGIWIGSRRTREQVETAAVHYMLAKLDMLADSEGTRA